MSKFFTWIRKKFNQWGYHDRDSKVVNYTPNKKGVYGRHLDWKSLWSHILFWICVGFIAIIGLNLVLHILVLAIVLVVAVYGAFLFHAMFSRKKG